MQKLKRFTLLLALLLCAAQPTTAQKGGQATPDPLLPRFLALIAEKDRGFNASELVLASSFAQHLHGPNDPPTVAELSRLYAAYDPASDSRATAGMLYFHLARPVEILRRIGGGRNEVFARIIEIRLRWLAGHTDLALQQATDLIAAMDEPGANWSNPEMTSLHADAAVLAHRAGDTDAAQTYFARARECGVQQCPADLVFGWLGPERRPSDDALTDYDPQAMRQVAEANAATVFPGDDTVLRDIAQEELLVTHDSAAVLEQALRLAQSTPDSATLTGLQRRQMRQLAERLPALFTFESYLMDSDSIGWNVRILAQTGDSFDPADIEDTGYLGDDGLFTDMLIGNLPLVIELLRHSDRRGDDILAQHIKLRLILAAGQRERAVRELAQLAAQARAQGFSDGELFSVLIDLWAAATLTGQTALADEAFAATAACRAAPCFEDLTLAFFSGIEALPQMGTPAGLQQLTLAAAEPFVQATFPDDRLRLADLYDKGQSQSRPMDAARDSELSLRFAESAPDIAPEELVKRAAKTMDTLIYAGKFSSAATIGDRIARRVTDAGHEDALSGRFYQVRARAAFRLDDPRARGFYAKAVELGGDRDLALDLLDTNYLELLDRHLAISPADAGILARLRYRQERFAEAADVLKAERRRREEYGTRDRFANYFRARAAIHLRGGSLDAYAAAMVRAQAAEAGADIPADSHLAYGYFSDLKALAFQEAVYRDAADDPQRARELRNLGGRPGWFFADWAPLPDTPDAAAIAAFERRDFKSDDSYDLIRDIIELRDNGNYDAAAQYMKSRRWVAIAAEANGAYVDAQTLWQMAFTFARVGETDIAFDLMNRAARIAATLSFEGAGDGMLQLLERDRWRYLLFIDIAWAAVTGQAPQDMLVVSRY